jgi:hypothetical protein
MNHPDLLLKDTNALHVTRHKSLTLPLDTVINKGIRGIFKGHYRAYRDVVIHTYDLSLMRKPFNKAVLLRLLARRRCWFKDDKGKTKSLTMSSFLDLSCNLVIAHLLGVIGKHRFLKCLNELEGSLSKKTQKTQGRSIPLYFRTDLIFGLKSGGSVTHIGGVINSLVALKGGIRMITTDTIPTVSDDVSIHIVLRNLAILTFRRYANFCSTNTLSLFQKLSLVTSNQLLSTSDTVLIT